MSKPPVFLTLFFLALCSDAQAIDTLRVEPSDPILQEGRWTTFDLKSGLVGWVNDVCQDRDGNIWFATEGGVQKYDGYCWITYTTRDGLADNDTRMVMQTRDGTMWFGTVNGLVRFNPKLKNPWVTYTVEDGLPRTIIGQDRLFQARDGTLWAGAGGYGDYEGTKRGISRFDGQTWTQIDIPVGPPRPMINTIYETADGAIWFGTDGFGLTRLKEGQWTRYTIRDGLAVDYVNSLFEDIKGTLWAFSNRGGGISRFDGARWHAEPELIPVRMSQAADGTLWAQARGRSGNRNFYRFDGVKWRVYPTDHEEEITRRLSGKVLPDSTLWRWEKDKVFRFDTRLSSRWRVYPVFNTALGSGATSMGSFSILDGELWCGGGEGVLRFDGKTWVRYTIHDGLLDGNITTILKDKQGRVWAAGQHQGQSGIAQFDGRTWHRMAELEGPERERIFSGFTAANGDVWFALKTGMEGGRGVARYDGKSWTIYGPQDGLIHPAVYTMSQASDKAIWFGTFDGLSRYDGTHWIDHKLPVEGYGANKIRVLYFDQKGDLWIGQHGPSHGLWHYDGQTWKAYRKKDGLSSEFVYSIYESRNGLLWFGTNLGLNRYDGKTWTVYDKDENPVPETILSIGETSGGVFWRGGFDRLVRFIPDKNPPETDFVYAPKRVSAEGHIALIWLGHDLWNETHPEDLRYQWRLYGEGWSAVSKRTDHTFTALKSGQYRFEVRAIDEDWNIDPTPAVHVFVVAKPWWQKPWVFGPIFFLIGLVGVQTVRVFRRDRALKDSLEAQLLQSSRLVSLGQMTAGVAHELNQPLNAISTAAEDVYLRLSEGMSLSDEELKPIMKDVLSMVDRMSDTVDHLRVFSRDKQDEPPILFDVNDVVHSSLQILGTQLKGRGIEVVLNLAEALPQVTGHPHQMEQVLLNLIGNARDALDGGEREQRLGIETRSENGTVVIEVVDNGCGMDAEIQRQIFEPFFTTKEAEQGTGLGLSISYAIVKNHDGYIGCESKVGEGTKFWVKLPGN